MEECKPTVNIGLRGVTVATTKICKVDGAAGKLIYRGYLAVDLAEKVSFEEVVHLLLHEKLPSHEELSAIKADLIGERNIPDSMIVALRNAPKTALPMDVLQTCASMLSHDDSDVNEFSREASLRISKKLIAKFPTLVAAWNRIRNGKEPVAPDSSLDHAANFLYMLNGKAPDPELAKFMDVNLVLHAEHSFNASTFAAREVASTRAHLYASVSAAVGSLSGELHGGANVKVMKMLMEIGSPDAIDAYIQKQLEDGKLIFGLGHAVYKVDDPRCAIIAPMSKRMGERTGETKWYEISRILERRGKEAFKSVKGIDIFVNVDFYTASLYHAMGIPVDLFSSIFAVARISGWGAHVIEEQFAEAAPKPALYRPESEYIGEYCGPDECPFLPIERR
jgi:citrate synthase